ncbi:lectin [Armillaria fumosa]|nr:lectin [Armillaria fumosa]
MFSKSEGCLLPAFIHDTLGRSLNARDVAPVLDFTHSTWIWTGEQTGPSDVVPVGVRPFRKVIPSSSTKCPVCVTILLSCDDHYSVFVNGREIGSGACWHSTAPFMSSYVFTVGLDPEGHNVVAIAGKNVGRPAGLIATMLVDYSDGTTETIVIDNTWKTLKAASTGGWTSPSYNDTAWTAAVSEGSMQSTPWKSPLPPTLNMTGVPWIQTNEPFRKTIASPYGKAAVCGKVVLSADDSYTLYVNGKNIGSGSGWTKMQAYSIPTTRANDRVYLAASMLIAYNDGTSEVYSTDGSRKTMNGLPLAGFEQPDADGSDWYGATIWPGPAVGTDVTVPYA